MCTQQRKTLRSKSASSTFFLIVFFLLCGVSFFFTRERERESFRQPEKGRKGRGTQMAVIKKRDLYRKRVALRLSQTLSSFPFLSVSNPKFFITSLHTYHTHYCEHAAHVDVSIITIALLILLRDSSRNCCCCGFHQSVERDFIIIIIITQMLPSQQKQKSSVDCVFVVVSSSFKRRRVRRRGSRRSRHSAIRGQSFRRRDEERFQLRRVVRGKL